MIAIPATEIFKCCIDCGEVDVHNCLDELEEMGVRIYESNALSLPAKFPKRQELSIAMLLSRSIPEESRTIGFCHGVASVFGLRKFGRIDALYLLARQFVTGHACMQQLEWLEVVTATPITNCKGEPSYPIICRAHNEDYNFRLYLYPAKEHWRLAKGMGALAYGC